jgi:hypothetical protein
VCGSVIGWFGTGRRRHTNFDLQSGAHSVAALEQASPGHGADELAVRSSCRNQLGFSASWAKCGVKITRSTSRAIPTRPRANFKRALIPKHRLPDQRPTCILREHGKGRFTAATSVQRSGCCRVVLWISSSSSASSVNAA